MKMTDQEKGDAFLADAEISAVRAELVEIMTSSYVATLLGEDESARRFANEAQDLLLLNLDAWQIVRLVLGELFPEYKEKAMSLMGDIPRAAQ